MLPRTGTGAVRVSGRTRLTQGGEGWFPRRNFYDQEELSSEEGERGALGRSEGTEASTVLTPLSLGFLLCSRSWWWPTPGHCTPSPPAVRLSCQELRAAPLENLPSADRATSLGNAWKVLIPPSFHSAVGRGVCSPQPWTD